MPEPVREESPWKSLAEFFSPSSARNWVPIGRRTEGLMASCSIACLTGILLYAYCLPLSLITMPVAEPPCRSSPLELPEVVTTAAACTHAPGQRQKRGQPEREGVVRKRAGEIEVGNGHVLTPARATVARPMVATLLHPVNPSCGSDLLSMPLLVSTWAVPYFGYPERVGGVEAWVRKFWNRKDRDWGCHSHAKAIGKFGGAEMARWAVNDKPWCDKAGHF